MNSSLLVPHGFAAGGVKWQVTLGGISIDGQAPQGSGGAPVTIMRVWRWFGDEIVRARAQYPDVPRPILLAIICNEAAGGQTDQALVCTARREEPGYVSDLATPERVSIGCCQTLLSTARLALDRPQLAADDLHNPATSILAAAAYIQAHALTTKMDPPLVAAAYNAGGLYPEPVGLNRWGLRCYPLGTGAYIDRFCEWYNDAMAAGLR